MASMMSQVKAVVGRIFGVSDTASLPRTDGEFRDSEDWERAECNRLDLLVREGAKEHDRTIHNSKSLRQLWTEAGRAVLGDQWDYEAQDGVFHYTINMTRPLVIAHAAAQTEQDPAINLQPVNVGGEPMAIFFSPKGGRRFNRMAMAGAVQAAGFSTAQLSGDEPLSIDQFELLTEPDPLTGLPPLMKKDDFIVVNDVLLAKEGQRLFDLYWSRAGGNITFMCNEYLSNTFGHQPMLFEVQADPFRFVLTNPHVCNVIIDPNAETIEQAEYLSFDQVMSAGAARVMYPDFAVEIDRISTTGGNFAADSATIALADKYTSTMYERRMVVIRTVWERNYPFFLTEQEALEKGLVQLVPWGADEAVEQGLVVGTATEATEAAEAETEEPDESADAPDVADASAPSAPGFTDPTTGEPIDEQHPNWPTRYVLVADGEPVDPPEEGTKFAQAQDSRWPVRYGIRQVSVIHAINRVLDDRECPFDDFPWAWNRNSIIQYSAYGLGEPACLRDLQSQINRLATQADSITRWYAFPQTIYPQSILDHMDAKGIEPHSRPNQTIGIPDADYERYFVEGKRTGFSVPPPGVPEQTLRQLPAAMAIFNQVGGNVDVMQGTPPDSGMSGAAIAQLTSNAKGPLAFKSKFSEDALQRIGRLAIDALLRYLPEDEWAKYGSRYRPAVFAVVKEAIKCADWSVTVELVSGRGANKAQTKAEAREDYKAALISKRTARERMGEDPDLEERRTQEELEEAARDQMRQAMAVQPQGMEDPNAGQPQAAQPSGAAPMADGIQATQE